MTESLLPPNATDQERSIELAISRPIDLAPVSDQWNPITCPIHLLPWLAWAYSVDEWDPDWPEEEKRDTLAEVLEIQRRKGTIDSIRRVLRSAGYEEVEIIEGLHRLKRDGIGTRNGVYTHGDPDAWPHYVVVLQRSITNQQAEQVRRLLGNTSPVRCYLKLLDYRQALHLHNGQILRDGTYNRGVA